MQQTSSIETGQCFLKLPSILQSGAEIVPCLGEIRAQRHGLAKGVGGLGGLMRFPPGVAEIVVRLGEIRPQGDGAAKTFHRLFNAPRAFQQQAEIVMHFGKRGIFRQDRAVKSLGLRAPPGLVMLDCLFQFLLEHGGRF